MLRAKRGRKPFSVPEISLTPLIDTVLVLLVIFMLCAPIVHNVISLQLPATVTSEKDLERKQKEAIFVFVDNQKNLFCNDRKVSQKELTDKIRTKIQDDPNQLIILHADKLLDYGAVLDLFDILSIEAKASNIALATEKK